MRTEDGRVISVKSDKPIKKTEIFSVMAKVNFVRVSTPVHVGDVLIKSVTEDINIVSTCNEV